jgi:hypothetical protein
MFKRKDHEVSILLLEQAEEISNELAQLTAPLEGVAWEIDEALSSIRKDEAGYRQGNSANRDGGGCYVPGELEKAVRRGKQLLLALSALRELQSRWDREELGLGPVSNTLAA